MGLEAGTYVQDLVSTNPTSSDGVSQGDDHLRLIKSTVKTTFPDASKPLYFPKVLSKSADFSVTSVQAETTFLVNTGAGVVTGTLPTLAAGDAGWACYFIKTTTDVNPLLIAPPSGTIQSGDQSGLAKTRRCIPGAKTYVYWTGSAWIAERCINVPIGTILDCPRTGLPVGYEWANGQTLASASANYPDFFQANGSSGVVQDRRGRIAPGRDDMGGSAASRLGTVVTDNGTIVGTTLGSTGGQSTHLQVTAEVGVHGHSTTESAHSHTFNDSVQGNPTSSSRVVDNLTGGSFGGAGTATAKTISINSATTGLSVNNSAAASAMSWLQPSIITNYIVAVE